MVTTRNRITLAVAGALAALFMLSAPAWAGYKPYSVVISNADGSTPATLAGGAAGTVLATYTNRTGQQQLGSSDLTVPAGLHVSGASVAPSGTATVVGDVIQLRSLNLAPGGSATVSVQVSPACPSVSYTWPAPTTKQANNFSGTPGNDLNLDAATSDLRTVVVGGCILRFAAQPKNARATQAISNSPYNASGPPVSVEVVNATGQRVTTSSFAVTVGIGANPGGGTLSGTRTVSTVNGLASFSTLSIDQPGSGYTLVAASPGATPATSDAFSIDQVAVVCTEDLDCSGSLPLKQTDQTLGGSSSIGVTAVHGPAAEVDAGFLTLSLRVGGPLDCANYAELSASLDVIAVDYSALDREKVVVATIDKRVMNATSNNGAAFLQSCFGAPYTFATKPGTPLEVNTSYVPGPYAAPEYKGLLPDCGGSAQLDDPNTPGVSGALIGDAGAPCVVKRRKTGAGDGIIESRWPSGRQVGIGDPRGRF